MDDQPPAPASQHSTTASDNAPSQTDSDSLVQKIKPSKHEQKTNQNGGRASDESAVPPPMDKPREKAKWTDIAIVILTFGIVAWAGLQWWEMHDAGTQTNKIIAADERLATAMENSVTQAQGAFNAANKQAILSQRAWMQVKVGIESPSHVWTVGQPIDIRIKQKNTGRTPALNLKSVNIIAVQEAASGDVFKAPAFFYKPDQYVRSGNLTPDGEVFSDFVKPFTAEDESRIVSLKVRVYVHGIVEYDDVFGIHHWVKFCNYLFPGQAFAICEYHNEIDQNEK